MKALVCVDGPQMVEFREVREPFVERGEAVVRVEAISVNRGELHRLSDGSHLGWCPGWDFAGTVTRSPAGGPPVGTRVCGMTVEGAWAEQVSVPVGRLAAIPDGVSLETAAALPVAGLTALRTLRLRGPLAGQCVLVMGASGGVGRLAVQLAHRAGAHVTAVVGGPERAVGLRDLGADEVVHGLGGLRRAYDLILESVGGDVLRRSLELVAPGGTVVSFGSSSKSETVLRISDFYPKQATLRGFYLLYEILRDPPSEDLAHLLALCAKEELTAEVAAVSDWSEVTAVLGDLRARRVPGKAVLRVSASTWTPDGFDE